MRARGVSITPPSTASSLWMLYMCVLPCLITPCLPLNNHSIGASPSTTMSKRTSAPSNLGPKKRPSTGSSVERPVNLEPLISKDTSRYEDGVLSLMFQVSSHLGRISRGQQVLLDRIEDIAAKMETLKKEVKSMKEEEKQKTKMNKPGSSWLPSNKEIEEFLNSPIQSPERGYSMDLTCSEMPYPSMQPLNDPTSMFDGFGDLPEWVKVDWPTETFQTPTLKTPEQSGGTDISVKKKS